MTALPKSSLVTPPAQSAQTPLRVVIVGHVDHGKSTLIGRLLHESGSLPDGKLEQLRAVSARRGTSFEWSFLLDALQSERDQGITIDTSQTRLHWHGRDMVLIDAPGHQEFLRNMITGAAQADAALLLIDAVEGARDQTRRHAHLLRLLGIPQIAVVVNKMDRLDFDAKQFRLIEAGVRNYLSTLGLEPIAVIPVSARHGDGVVSATANTAWYQGPTVVEALYRFASARALDKLPLRLSVQAVYKFEDRRVIAGRVESGRISVGDEVVVMPTPRLARVRSIETWSAQNEEARPQSANAGQSIGITLDDELFIERGNIIASGAYPDIVDRFRARVFWFAEEQLRADSLVTVRIGTAEVRAVVAVVELAIDPGRLSPLSADILGKNHVGEVELALSRPVALDCYDGNPRTGRVALDLDGRISGGGIVLSGSKSTALPKSELEAPAGAPDAPRTGLSVMAARLSAQWADLSPGERLMKLRNRVAGKIVFTTSFGLEDQAIMHLLALHRIDVEVVTIDTGRLFPETYQLWGETERRYDRRIKALYPDAHALELLVERQGINGFYQSRGAREACCHVRKVVPLGRALAGAAAWIVGLRAEQSTGRRELDIVTADSRRSLLKMSPLFDWTRIQLEQFVETQGVPVNPLHAKGFASIGCASCTRAVATDEPERAGRWWWEHDDHKECGLHVSRQPAAAALAIATTGAGK